MNENSNPTKKKTFDGYRNNKQPNKNAKKKSNNNPNKKTSTYKRNQSPISALEDLQQTIKSELINEENSAPHLVLVDPRDSSSRLSIVYFASNSHFRVYDNYDAKIGDNQEVFLFGSKQGVIDFILSNLDDESGCFEAYSKIKEDKKED